MTKVTELIRPEQAAAWTTTDTIFITAGTGGGKSYFIKNTLYDVAKNLDKKILFLIHRINCVNQFEYEIVNSQKTDVIDIRTYQHLEHGAKTNLSAYDYIVCDESHYFFSDALFSNTTDISLNKILKQEHATKIFMSACGDYTKGYLKHIKKIDVKEYDIPVSYDFISELIFYNSDKSLDEIVKKIIKSKKKAILFINKLEEAYALYSKYKEDRKSVV